MALPSFPPGPRPALAALGLFLLTGCQHTFPTAHSALRAGLVGGLVQGGAYKHATFVSDFSPGQPLYVFIEGDGLPWRRQGTAISSDPTPRRALALSLAVETPGSRLYVGRPCYFSAIRDAACNPKVWTSERFSAAVVDSMAAVVNDYCAARCGSGVVLIGYSGGGVLAALMAPRVPTTVAVVTIAADLDIDAWTRLHGYSPLDGSLNPATQSALPPRLKQLHLVGDRDEQVPPSLNQRYFVQVDPKYVWHYAEFDHICCWAEHWPEILSRIDAVITSTHYSY